MLSSILSRGRFAGLLASATLAVAAIAGTAHAGDLPAGPTTYYAAAPVPAAPAWFFNEIRIGGLAHGVGTPERGSADVNAEILSRQLFQAQDPYWQFLVPRLHLGTDINTGGKTSQFYGGLTWTYDITKNIFIEGSLGGAYHDGKTGIVPVPYDRAKLGCHLLFRESVSLGYRITDQISISAYADHISNGTLCEYNRGLNNYGARLGYSF